MEFGCPQQETRPLSISPPMHNEFGPMRKKLVLGWMRLSNFVLLKWDRPPQVRLAPTANSSEIGPYSKLNLHIKLDSLLAIQFHNGIRPSRDIFALPRDISNQIPTHWKLKMKHQLKHKWEPRVHNERWMKLEFPLQLVRPQTHGFLIKFGLSYAKAMTSRCHGYATMMILASLTNRPSQDTTYKIEDRITE